MPSFNIPLSGLSADSSALNTIANNLANMSTTGYKDQVATFSSMLYQAVGSSGSGDPIQEGSGVKLAANATDFTTGSISATGAVYSDAAIDGTGFFVLNDGNGGQLLTRNGNFTVSNGGTLQNSDGLAVMGYNAVNGKINSSGAVSNINIPVGQVMKPAASTEFSVTQTLDSSSPNGTTTPGTLTLYDSLGQQLTGEITYTNNTVPGGPNTWGYQITLPQTLTPIASSGGSVLTFGFGAGATVDPTTNLSITGTTSGGGTATILGPTVTQGESLTSYITDVRNALSGAGITSVTLGTTPSGALTISGATATSGSIVQDANASGAASGSLVFDSNGNLTSPAFNVSGITFSGLSDGSGPLSLTWNILNSSGGSTISSTAEASSQSAQSADGYPTGDYSGEFSIASDGVISAKYTNGQTQTLGQLAVATVSNEQGLMSAGSSAYETTSASGTASVGIAGQGGRGVIDGGELEASNVNISQEFSNLIVAQRAFEASSKAVTTFDAVTEQTIQMIH